MRGKHAATAALNGPEDCIAEMRATYKRRRDVLIDCFGKAGWPIPSPTASKKLKSNPNALPIYGAFRRLR